jgi:hypothetical protein
MHRQLHSCMSNYDYICGLMPWACKFGVQLHQRGYFFNITYRSGECVVWSNTNSTMMSFEDNFNHVEQFSWIVVMR